MKTINKFFLLLGGLALTAGMTGCEDKRGEHLEEFSSRVYFRNGGDQTIRLYRVADDKYKPVYAIPICKGGSDLSYTAEATVRVVDDSQLEIYNMNHRTNYKQLPDDCYKFVKSKTDRTENPEALTLHFSTEETSKEVYVELDPIKIGSYQENAPGVEYALALQVYSDRQVTDVINLLLLIPETVIPVVSFVLPGLREHQLSPMSPTITKVPVEVVLGMDNEWDFTCDLGVYDQAWLDEYNAKNGTEYELMPEGACEYPEKVQFEAGSNSVNFEVTIDRTKLEGQSMFTNFVLPIYLAKCEERPDFELSSDVILAHAVFTPILEPIVLTADMLETKYTHEGESIGVPGLVDGKSDTFWHSLWSGTIPAGDQTYGVYIDITIDEELDGIQFRYQTRHDNGNGVPTHICIGASENGEEWVLIQEVNKGLPADAGAWGELPIVTIDKHYKHFRFGIANGIGGDCRTDPPGFTALGELQLYGFKL